MYKLLKPNKYFKKVLCETKLELTNFRNIRNRKISDVNDINNTLIYVLNMLNDEKRKIERYLPSEYIEIVTNISNYLRNFVSLENLYLNNLERIEIRIFRIEIEINSISIELIETEKLLSEEKDTTILKRLIKTLQNLENNIIELENERYKLIVQLIDTQLELEDLTDRIDNMLKDMKIELRTIDKTLNFRLTNYYKWLFSFSGFLQIYLQTYIEESLRRGTADFELFVSYFDYNTTTLINYCKFDSQYKYKFIWYTNSIN